MVVEATVGFWRWWPVRVAGPGFWVPSLPAVVPVWAALGGGVYGYWRPFWLWVFDARRVACGVTCLGPGSDAPRAIAAAPGCVQDATTDACVAARVWRGVCGLRGCSWFPPGFAIEAPYVRGCVPVGHAGVRSCPFASSAAWVCWCAFAAAVVHASPRAASSCRVNYRSFLLASFDPVPSLALSFTFLLVCGSSGGPLLGGGSPSFLHRLGDAVFLLFLCSFIRNFAAVLRCTSAWCAACFVVLAPLFAGC